MKSAALFVVGLVVSFMLSGCLSGGGAGGGAGGGSSATNLKTLTITTPHGGTDGSGNPLVRADLSGGAFTVSWDSSWSSPSNLAAFEFYLSEDAVIDPDEQLLYRNCGSLSIYSCNKSGSVSCALGSNGVISCGSFDSLNVATVIGTTGKTLNAVGRVCIYDSTMKYVCSSKTAAVRMDPVF